MDRLGRASKMAYLEVSFPFPLKNREALMYGFGVNRIKTHGSIYCIAKSASLVDDPLLLERMNFDNFKRA